MSDSNANRRDPFSEEFKKFIVSGWAPYSSELPATLPSAVARPSSSSTPTRRWCSPLGR